MTWRILCDDRCDYCSRNLTTEVTTKIRPWRPWQQRVTTLDDQCDDLLTTLKIFLTTSATPYGNINHQSQKLPVLLDWCPLMFCQAGLKLSRTSLRDLLCRLGPPSMFSYHNKGSKSGKITDKIMVSVDFDWYNTKLPPNSSKQHTEYWWGVIDYVWSSWNLFKPFHFWIIPTIPTPRKSKTNA